MIDRLEKLNNLKDKIHDRIDEVDSILIQTTLYDNLIEERLRLRKVLDDVYTDISIVEHSMWEPED